MIVTAVEPTIDLSYFHTPQFHQFLDNVILTNEKLSQIEDLLFAQITRDSHTQDLLSEEEFISELQLL